MQVYVCVCVCVCVCMFERRDKLIQLSISTVYKYFHRASLGSCEFLALLLRFIMDLIDTYHCQRLIWSQTFCLQCHCGVLL